MLVLPSQAQITVDGSLGPRVPRQLQGPEYTIAETLGERRSTNLFHSFGEFNIHTGERATFTGSADITNVLSRITGGQPSRIDGLLRSEIPGANLFLLNPSGVLFGPNAALDVSGAFHVSTADYVRLGEEGRFSAHLSEPSILSAAPPAAFGFLGPQPPAAITVDNSSLAVPGTTLSVVGGNITIIGPGMFNPCDPRITLSSSAGRIHLTSVASAGEVPITPTPPTVAMDGPRVERLGKVTIQQGAFVHTIGDDGSGTVVIQAGDLQIIEGSVIASDIVGASDGAEVGIELRVQNEVVIGGGSIVESGILSGGSSGDAGDVQITAGRVEVREGSFLGSPGVANSTGMRGDVIIYADSMLITGVGSSIDTSTPGAGDGGHIYLTVADSIEISGDNARIASEGLVDSGGNGGSITITTGYLSLTGGGRVDTSMRGAGVGGDITITATEHITLAGRDSTGTTQSQIVSGAFQEGSAGSLTITVPVLRLDDSMISASAEPNSLGGNAGAITINVAQLELLGGAQISSSTFAAGRGGPVTVQVAESLTITGQRGEIRSAISSTAQEGSTAPGGQVVVLAPAATLTLSDGGAISAQTSGTEGAGDVWIEAGRLLIIDGGQIDSLTTGPGDAGNVTVMATEEISITGQESDGTPSEIASSSSGSGNGGLLLIQAPILTMEGGAILSATERSGTGGDIEVTAQRVDLRDNSLIAANSLGAGNAGTIMIRAGEMFRSRNSKVTTAAALAGGGNIDLQADLIQLTDSSVTAAASGQDSAGSDGGNVTVIAQRALLNRSIVSANAFGGAGGSITISASAVFLADAETCGAGQCLSASSELGVDGTVEVSAPVSNVSGTLAPLPQSFSTNVALLREQCVGRHASRQASRFVVGGRDGVPVEPGHVLPSPPLAPHVLSARPAQGATAPNAWANGGEAIRSAPGVSQEAQRLAQTWDMACAKWRQEQRHSTRYTR